MVLLFAVQPFESLPFLKTSGTNTQSDTNTQTWVGGFLEVIEVLPHTVGDNIEKPFSVWGGQSISKMKSSDESRNPVSD